MTFRVPSALQKTLVRIALPLAFGCGAGAPVAGSPESGASHAPEPGRNVHVEAGWLARAPGAVPAVSVYRGIPFAAAPIGDLRWKPPEAAPAWPGVREALAFGPNCLQELRRQLLPWTPEYMPRNGVSEDCLSLNVWTPSQTGDERLPVLVYIHGGAFATGSGDVLVYDGERLAARGVVVVTLNYRLGVFGFFAHPELTRESPHTASGNYGLLDQIAALEWVQRNIAAFGGDPGAVTIAGQSAGAGSVHLLTASPRARGLFQRAIAQSGPWRLRQRLPNLGESEARGSDFAALLGAESLSALRALPAAVVLGRAIESKIAFRPSVDGWAVPDQVPAVYTRHEQADVPLLTGITADEGSSQQNYGTFDVRELEAHVKERFGERASLLLALYPAASDAEAHERQKQLARDEGLAELFAFRAMRAASGTARDFGYFFERAIPWPEQPRYQAFHSAELPYVFDNLGKLERPWENVDRELGELMVRYWVNFVRNGDPNAEGLPRWPSASDQVMRLGPEPHAEPLPAGPAANVWAQALGSGP
jgi:para-nitrobenzyl esterase